MYPCHSDTPRLVIIGGGFAGLWATAAASERRSAGGADALDITLVTATPGELSIEYLDARRVARSTLDA